MRGIPSARLFAMAIFSALVSGMVPARPAGGIPPPGGNGRITLQEAVTIAVERNPRAAVIAWDVAGAGGRIRQATARPNPELDAEVENVGGGFDGFRSAETTVSVSQLIETAGKRNLRRRRAEADLRRIERAGDAARLDVVTGTTIAFVELLGAQKRLDLVRQDREIASELHAVASERVRAGAISPIEETRAKVALALSEAEVGRAAGEVQQAREALSAAMGEESPSFDGAAGDLSEDLTVPDLPALEARMRDHPAAARWETERAFRETSLSSERALARPDVTVRAGFRYLAEDSLSTFVVGASVPLPVFDTNRGSVREAETEIAKAGAEGRAEEVRLRAELRRRHAELSAAAAEALVLREEALAGAQGAYEAVREGYTLGKFRYLDLLDAGKSLGEVRLRYLETLVRLNVARAGLEGLAGGAVPGPAR